MIANWLKSKFLLIIIWSAPILAFPSESENLSDKLTFARYYIYDKYGSTDLCFAPFFISIIHSEPAPWFLSNSAGAFLCPLWMIWLIYIGLASFLTAYVNRTNAILRCSKFDVLPYGDQQQQHPDVQVYNNK